MNTIMKIIKSPLTWLATALLFGATGLVALGVGSLAGFIITLIAKKM